ncbi:DUF2790 domain-containing protein [Pseudomonas silvicola]|nr:DUF2790 domain-containing protein [Pseudomonas silvicola]
MKYLIALALSLLAAFTSFARADDAAAAKAAQSQSSYTYDYSQDLDIAKVVRMNTRAGSQCGPVQGHMTYIDSKGVQHELNYTRLGGGCDKG